MSPAGETCKQSVRERGRGIYGSKFCGRPVFKGCLCKRHYEARERAAAKLRALSHLGTPK